MEYLLDTHSFLWFINGDDQIAQKVKNAITDPEAMKYIMWPPSKINYTSMIFSHVYYPKFR